MAALAISADDLPHLEWQSDDLEGTKFVVLALNGIQFALESEEAAGERQTTVYANEVGTGLNQIIEALGVADDVVVDRVDRSRGAETKAASQRKRASRPNGRRLNRAKTTGGRGAKTTRSRSAAGGARGAGHKALASLSDSIDSAQAALKDLRSETGRGSGSALKDVERQLKDARTKLSGVSRRVTRELDEAQKAAARRTSAGKPAAKRTTARKATPAKPVQRKPAAHKPVAKKTTTTGSRSKSTRSRTGRR